MTGTSTAPADFQLFETLRFTPQAGYFLLDAHLERLAVSGRHFGFACPQKTLVRALHAAARPLAEPKLIRLQLAADGRFAIEARPLPAPVARARAMLSGIRVESRDPWLAHKTTRRALYDSEHARLAGATGCFEVLFANERGELTEGSRTNVFIENNGVWRTPPLACGLLPGVLRAHLLRGAPAAAACVLPGLDQVPGPVIEAVLPLAELTAADRVWVGNSVRGLVEVTLQ